MQKLAIILCTHNGQAFVQEQLDSFSNQTFKNWSLFVYDDASKDDTQQIIENYKANQTNRVEWIANNPPLGFAKNFLNAIKSTPSDFDLYALSDQDDIWLETKLQKAKDYFKTTPLSTPALYCARTLLIDSTGHKIGFSPCFTRPPSFENSLVQSIAGGNTMVFNKAAQKLIRKIDDNIDVISHDWFIYQLITGAGGTVYYDPSPCLLYRQHENNLIGSNTGLFARLLRIRKLMNGSFKKWNDKNIEALQSCISILTKEKQRQLRLFEQARKQNIIDRLLNFKKLGIYRQTFTGNIALIIGAILNKI